MSIIIFNDGDRIVDTIAQRDALTKRFPGMQVTVKDAIGDPQTGGGFAKYEWVEDGANSYWGLVQVDKKISMKFATERHTIENGRVTADNIPLDAKVWSCRVIDAVSGVILGDVNQPVVEVYDVLVGSLDYEGHLLEFTYAYGSFSTQLDSVIYQLKDKQANLVSSVINLKEGSVFSKTVTENLVFEVTGVEALGLVDSFIIELTNGGAHTITWFDNVLWDSGIAPTLTETGLDIVAFYTHDGGLTWRGVVVGSDMRSTTV